MQIVAKGGAGLLENIIRDLFNLNEDCEMTPVEEHEGGRNFVYICKYRNEPKYAIRVSMIGDRTENEYLAEAEYVHFLAQGGASVADVIPSVNGKPVEEIILENREIFISCFEYARGILISDNGYQYMDGRPLSEYFFNTGKTLGKIHRLSKKYSPVNKRQDYFEKYNMEYINSLLSEEYSELKYAIAERFELFKQLSRTSEDYGLVHFDFSDGNYHIDMENGNITVFDFDNCMYCWYMFDLANLWTHGEGWCQFEENPEKRRAFMKEYFDVILAGYRTETDLSETLLEKLPLFIDMVLIENIVDEFECCQRDNRQIDYEDIEDAAESLIHNIPWAGFFGRR